MTPNAPMTEFPVELEPCPFCGGEAEHQTDTEEPEFAEEWIGCLKCGATTAVEIWNRRASQSLRAPAGEAPKPLLYGAVYTATGEPWLDQDCVSTDPGFIEDRIEDDRGVLEIVALYASPPSEGVKVTDEMIEGMCRAFVGHHWGGETEFLKDQYRSNMRRAAATLLALQSQEPK